MFNNENPEYLAINPKIMSSVFKGTKKERESKMAILDQLKSNSKIQYVYLEDPDMSEYLLSTGLIKSTKKVGKDTYIVPKGVAQIGIESDCDSDALAIQKSFNEFNKKN
jgi:hypothetical protein